MMDIPACLANILTTPPPPAYRVVTLAGNGTVLGSLPILVGDDEQGRERAKSMVSGHAVELWDRPALHRVLPAAHVTAALRTVRAMVGGTAAPACGCSSRRPLPPEEFVMLTGSLLWLLGVPIPVLILVWFFFLRGR